MLRVVTLQNAPNIESLYPLHSLNYGVLTGDEAGIIGVPYTMLNEILNGKRPVTTETALLLEAALDINAEMLVNMQSSYSLQTARKNKTLANRFASIRQAYAVMML